jgi:type I restriction enzyme M protein
VERIVQAYQEFKEIKGFCRPVSLEEIKKNNYNLNVTLYVFPEEEVEEIDVNKEWEELRKVDEQIVDVEKKIEGYLREIR